MTEAYEGMMSVVGDEQDEGTLSSVDLPSPPSQHLLLLARCASADMYYKIIIAKYQGIRTIIKIMDMYHHHLDIQVYALSTLADLTNKVSIHEHGGVPACIRAMTNFSNSIEVQSVGLHMLKMQALVLANEPHECLRPLREILEMSKQTLVDLTPAGKEGFIFVERFLDTYQI
jgi:hypothetical protein